MDRALEATWLRYRTMLFGLACRQDCLSGRPSCLWVAVEMSSTSSFESMPRGGFEAQPRVPPFYSCTSHPAVQRGVSWLSFIAILTMSSIPSESYSHAVRCSAHVKLLNIITERNRSLCTSEDECLP